MSVTTDLKAVTDFTEDDSLARRALGLAVYPESDTAGERIHRAREWARPQWGVMVTDDTGALVSNTGIVIREANVEEDPVRIGGIGGVATHPEHRRKGYASLGIDRAVDFLVAREADFALLVCRDELMGYYTALGWRPFAGTVLTTQYGEPEVFTFNEVMVMDLISSAPTTGTIDLQGPVW